MPRRGAPIPAHVAVAHGCSLQRAPPSRRSPARADTRHLRQRGGLLLWAGRWLDECRTVEGLKRKIKEREIPPCCLPV